MSKPTASFNTIDRSKDALWHWQAHLQLHIANSERGSRLNRCRHNGPLYVQKPFYPEGKDYAHLYLLHPPGGLVSGDNLRIDVSLDENSHSVITTPGAARMYRARTHASNPASSPTQKQHTLLSLANHASLEWFPMETIVYDGAAAQLSTTIELSDNSHIMAWEITCLGLPASQQPMQQGYFQQRYSIVQNGLPIFIDRLDYNASNPHLLTSMAGMQNNTVSGFFIAGVIETPEQENVIDTLRDMLQQQKLDHVMAISMVNGFCITRYLGGSANQARDGFTRAWEILRPVLLHRPACHPRIWLT